MTGREWLDVTHTYLAPYGSTIDEAVDAAKPELAPGGRFEGFTLAGRQEVFELVSASGFESDPYPRDWETADNLRRLLNLLDARGEEIWGGGPGVIAEGESGGIFGVIDEVAAVPVDGATDNIVVVIRVANAPPSGTQGPGVVEVTRTPMHPVVAPSDRVLFSSLLLYRTSIPEPTTTALVVIGVMGLAGSRRGRRAPLLACPTVRSGCTAPTA